MSVMPGSEAYFVLKACILRQVAEEVADWIKQVTENAVEYSDPRKLSIHIAIVPRRISGSNRLILSKEDLSRVQKIYKGWQPEKWLLIEAIRILFNLSVVHGSVNTEDILLRVYRIAELSEQVAFLKGLPLYGKTDFFLSYAKEAVRSNTRPLFAAIAQFNPFPADHFSESEWNNMVLKAVSWNYPLHNIYGVDERANPSLMNMLCEYAREQRGAKRPISIDLWRCVGPYADEDALADLAIMLNSADTREQLAAVLALNTCPSTQAKDLLDTKKDLLTLIKIRNISWETLNAGKYLETN